jgi:hypothetical protein
MLLTLTCYLTALNSEQRSLFKLKTKFWDSGRLVFSLWHYRGSRDNLPRVCLPMLASFSKSQQFEWRICNEASLRGRMGLHKSWPCRYEDNSIHLLGALSAALPSYQVCLDRSSINTCSPHSMFCCQQFLQDRWAHCCSHKALKTSGHCPIRWPSRTRRLSRNYGGISSKLHSCPFDLLEASAHSRMTFLAKI